MKESKPLVEFEIGSKQPFALFFITATIVSSLFIIIALSLSGFAFSYGKSLQSGDINKDSKIDASDALQIIFHEKRKLDFDGAQIDAADVNNDSKTDITDAILIVQYSSGVSKQLGIGTPAVYIPQSNINTNYNQNENTETENEPSSSPVQEITFEHSGSSNGTSFLTSEKGLYYTARIVNYWQNADGEYMYQIQLKVKNNSSSTIYSTTADIVFDNNIKVEKIWDCSAKSNDNKVGVKTDDSGPVKKGKTYSCGFIVSSTEKLNITGVEKP